LNVKKLVFVYNGDSGLVNGLMHYLHKRLSPETYPCQLCGLIHDGLSLKREWLDFVRSLGIETEYQHRDEYVRRYGKSEQAWPAVLLHEGDRCVATVIASTDFAQIDSLSRLQHRLQQYVATGLAPSGGALPVG
jgi:hypothetical protein